MKFAAEQADGVIPLEMKSATGATASLDKLLRPEDVPHGYKFAGGNVVVSGKKISLPHYLAMFVEAAAGSVFALMLSGFLVLFPWRSAFGSGDWLEKTPIGGIELGGADAWERKTIDAELDRLALENAAKPFIVTRTKWMGVIFDHARLGVNTNDLFVHYHADTCAVSSRDAARIKAVTQGERGRWQPCAGGACLSALDLSHTCPDWASVLRLGPRGLAARARARLATAKTEKERLFLECVAEAYDGLVREIVRWADFAEAKGMKEVAAVLRENAAHEPRTFREALQWALVYDRAQEAEGEDVRAQGLFDRLYFDYYRADLAAGRETRASAKKLISDWFTRFYSQQHPNNKNIAFGGYDEQGEPVWNELTELGFEVFRELGRINPKLTYRFGRKTPREQLEQVCACIASGRTSIVFMGEETSREMFRRRGVAEADLPGMLLVGCYEPALMGREVIASMAGDINLAKPLEAVFNGGKAFDGSRIGPDCGLPRNGDEFVAEYLRQLRAAVAEWAERTRAIESRWYEINPSPLFSGSFADCIASGKDAYDGGCRYNQSGADCIGLATVVDSLEAVRFLVDERKLVTMAELGEILKKDWQDREELRLLARNAAAKWGNGQPRVAAAAKQVYDAVTDAVNREPNGHGGTFQAGLWSIGNDMRYGGRTAATPDGRHAKETLSRNNAATAGCGREGATALMNDNLALDLANAPDGHIMDILLPLSLAKAPDGNRTIAAVLRSYFERGGQCLHLNCFDSGLLKDAMAHPEKYPDLQVRVCGWNVLWNDLSKAEQLHFLRTCEAQE